MSRPAKTVQSTAIEEHTYKVFPNDLNSHGTVFGGLVMSVLDRTALVVAERHSKCVCVTVSVDSMHFLAPAGRGDILIFKAACNRAWGSSMEVGVKVIAEHYATGKQTHILSAYFTFVALDEHDRPTKVPEIIAETPLEKRRFEEADKRRTRRKQEAEERRKARETWPL